MSCLTTALESLTDKILDGWIAGQMGGLTGEQVTGWIAGRLEKGKAPGGAEARQY